MVKAVSGTGSRQSGRARLVFGFGAMLAALAVSATFFLGCDKEDGGVDDDCPSTQVGCPGYVDPGTGSGTAPNIEPGSQFNPNIDYASFTDSRDGRSYKSVTIGSQVWMAENLNYNTSDSKCYGEGSPVSEIDKNLGGRFERTLTNGEIQANCAVYGRLYNWNTAMGNAASSSSTPSGVRGIYPSDWHLPGDAEWDTLVT